MDSNSLINKAPGGLTTVIKTVTDNNSTLVKFTDVYANTSGGAFTMNLPASPAVGDHIVIHDANNTFASYNLTLGRNSQLVNGVADNLECDLSGAIVNLRFKGGTIGWECVVESISGLVSAVNNSGGLINLTGATSDFLLQIGQTATIDYVAATSVPLRVATQEGEYEMTIIGDRTITASSTARTVLLPNNSNNTTSVAGTYTSAVNTGSYYDGAITNGVWVGDGRIDRCNVRINTITKNKTYDTKSQGMNTTYVVNVTTEGIWNDTTTPWTSLGTITFPFAQSGKIIIRRII